MDEKSTVEPADITQLLRRTGTGDNQAKDLLFEIVYDDLKRSASKLICNQNEVDVQATLLVHEVFLRFENSKVFETIANRRVFFSIALTAMKQVLIDYYRKRTKSIDSPTRASQPLESAIRAIEAQSGTRFDDLHSALDELERSDPRQHAVIMHRFFGGLTVEETATTLEVSPGTVERDWRLARAKLQRILWANQGET